MCRRYALSSRYCFLVQAISCLFISFGVLPQAYAANISGVLGPNFAPDDRSIQLRYAFEPADSAENENRYAYRLLYQHSFNAKWRTRIVSQFNHSDRTEYAFSRLEILYNMRSAKQHAWSSGFRFDFRKRRGSDPEEIAINWANQWDFANTTSARATLIVAADVEQANKFKAKLNTNFSLTHKLAGDYTLGLEMFSRWGLLESIDNASQHQFQIGPSIAGRVADYQFHLRYLSAIGRNARDHSIMLRLTHAF